MTREAAKETEVGADRPAMTTLHRRILSALMVTSLVLVGVVAIQLLGNDDPNTPADTDVAVTGSDDSDPEVANQPEPSNEAEPDSPTTFPESDDDSAEALPETEVAGSEQSREDEDGTTEPEAEAGIDEPAGEAEDADGDGAEAIEPEDPSSEAASTDAEASESEAAAGGDVDEALAADGPKSAVTIAFGGDMHFENDLGVRLANETETMLAPVADMMADADLAIANLETTVTDRGEPTPGKAYNFRTTPQVFDALKTSGIDVVSVANNHGMDFGLTGLEDTLAAAEASDYPIIGAGRNADEAFSPYVAKINGQSIAVIGATQVLDNSVRTLWTATDDQAGLASAKEVDVIVAAVAEARAEHDTVVVYLHWGIEGDTCPAPRQLELSDQLIEAGADIIVGGHAHRLQSGGFKDGAFVHYGMGNFVFYKYSGPSTESGVLKVTVNGRDIEGYEWVPATLSNGVATANDSADDLARWNDRRSCTDLTDTNS